MYPPLFPELLGWGLWVITYAIYMFPGGFLPLLIITNIILTAAPISFVPFLRVHNRIRDHGSLGFLKAHRREGCC